MRVIFDTNVVLDVLQNREPFVDCSAKLLKLSEAEKIRGAITANTATDIYYILNKHLRDKSLVSARLQSLLSIVSLTDVLAKDVRHALMLDMPDFEDALLAECALRTKATCIVTRDEKGFLDSSVPAMTPENFLKKHFPQLLQ